MDLNASREGTWRRTCITVSSTARKQSKGKSSFRVSTTSTRSSKGVLDVLDENNIKTAEDFVFSPIETLYQTLNPGLISFADFEGLRDRVVKHLSSEGVSANMVSAVSTVTDSEVARSRNFTNVTGHCNLDSLLAAVTPGLIELAGGNDADKTVPCLYTMS